MPPAKSSSSARAAKSPRAAKPSKPAAPAQRIVLPGQRRVVIDHVEPAVDRGLFPIKRIVGETVTVRADVFSDGHDVVQAVLHYRLASAKAWQEVAMRALGNDRWEAEFTLEDLGDYEYAVAGWVDHFLSWHHGMEAKAKAGAATEVDLQIGRKLLEGAADRAKGADARTLRGAAESITDTAHGLKERTDLALNPGLKAVAAKYPDRALETGCDPLRVQVEREIARFSAWYEFFPRSWSGEPGRHGTFRDAERLLPEIERMGFNVVYFPPIHPIGTSHRKGKNNTLHAEPGDVGSPWAIGAAEGGHKAIHPELGTMKDFQHFIAEADKHGIEVALDIALQCSPDHPYVKEHPQWFLWRPDGTVQYAENPPKKYQDVLPLNFETEDWENLWIELKSIFEYWIDAGVKIFRVDNPHTKPLEFWRWLISELRREHPEIVLLSEAFTRPRVKYRLAKAGFSQGYTYFTWRNTRDELIEYLTELSSEPVRQFFRPNFWPNTPDILPQALQYGGRPAFIARMVLAATMSSNWGMYGPAYELCVNGAVEGKEEYSWSEKYELKQWDWDAPGNLKEIIARVNRIRRQCPAMHRTDNIQFVPTDNNQIIAYLKATPNLGDVVLTVVNLDPYHTQSGWIDIPLGDLNMHGDRPYLVHDMLATGKYLWQGGRNFVKLEPHVVPAHIFHLFRHQRHEQDFDYYI